MRKFFTVIFFLSTGSLFAQSAFLPLGNEQYYQFIDRMEIKSGHMLTDIHSSVKPYFRDNIVKSLHNFDTIDPPVKFTRIDWRNLEYSDDDNTEWVNSDTVLSKAPVLNYFYRTKADLYSVKSKDFMVKLNPVLAFGSANADGHQDTLKDKMFMNTRGAEVRGWIAQKVGFYLFITENQARYPNYVQRYTAKVGSVPGEGYYKNFHKTGIDYFATRGYFNFKVAKFIAVTFGNDKNFFGNGYRSLQLSDFSQDYLYLKLNTQVWKINYTNIFTSLNADFQRGGDQLLPKKYAAFHHLSVNATKFLNVGLFEGVVFSRVNDFEFYYLNPIIFYRSVEQRLGSPDNSLIGADVKVNLLRHVSAYGQLTIDDMNISYSKGKKGYWGNKYAYQIGAKYVDAFKIENLDLQIENNVAVPYIYTHNDAANYTNYNQALAHPFGANFKEWVFIARYQPIPDLWLTGKYFSAQYGQDSTGTNFGGNINYPTTPLNVYQQFDNKIGQGVKTDYTMYEITATYMIKHNLFVDAMYISRITDAFSKEYSSDLDYFAISIRLNVGLKRFEF